MTNVVINRDVVYDLQRKLGHLETHNSSGVWYWCMDGLTNDN